MLEITYTQCVAFGTDYLHTWDAIKAAPGVYKLNLSDSSHRFISIDTVGVLMVWLSPASGKPELMKADPQIWSNKFFVKTNNIGLEFGNT